MSRRAWTHNPHDPEQVVAAIREAEDEDEVLDIEREAVQDTAEEDPGEVEEG